jgi:hypothetical protein
VAKKRGFVRYSKNGKLVPGSLIVTQGTHPDKPSTWKEVPYDICCGGGGCDFPPLLFSKTVTSGFPVNTADGCFPICIFESTCGNIFVSDVRGFDLPIINNYTLEQFIDALNQYYSWAATWTLDGTVVTVELNGYIAKALCPDGEITMNITVACPA